MHGEFPQGLTAHDFHRPAFINPSDVFPSKSRQSHHQGFRSFGLTRTEPSHHPSRLVGSPLHVSCYCANTGASEQDPASFDLCAYCSKIYASDTAALPNCCAEDVANPGDDEFDECEDCIEDHKGCDEDQVQCVDECDECIDEHDMICGQQGQICTETCDDCDFSCFDCVDWAAFEQDRSLGLSLSVPLLDEVDSSAFEDSMSFTDPRTVATTDTENQSCEIPVPPIELPMHHQCIPEALSGWNAMVPPQLCSIDGESFNFASAIPVPNNQTPGVLPFGCHPAAVHQTIHFDHKMNPNHMPGVADASVSVRSSTFDHQMPLVIPAPNNYNRICQWLMPCGTVCSAEFASMADLKKHLKATHVLKGTKRCAWEGCNSIFASEAALTGHVSKKHIANGVDDDGPFKCTFLGCTKSFMYKQVRDEHVASHNGNKMYCHICDQFLNSEGSNFRRHMASHRPKHQHMLCKHHHLGCKRRFPRLDNLRRHEACCKFGKKAALHHHHHHQHVRH